MKFEDTKLLDHPTVRKAYQVMRGFFSDGDDFAKQAVRAGEILSTDAKNPDPDAIAACVLMDGMIIPCKPESFEQTVSKQAAAYIQFYFETDPENPVYRTEGERQILLAHSIIALEGLCEEVKARQFWSYNEIKKKIDLNATSLEAILPETQEQALANAALSRLQEAQKTLEDIVHKKQEACVFEKTGLPDHPVIRAAYELMRESEINNDPLQTNYSKMGLGIAKVILETGASSDPEVIGAALLNQYWEKKNGALDKKFSSRFAELYRETSPWSDYDRNKERSEEADIIIKAARLSVFEIEQRQYLAYKKTPKARFDKNSAITQLERIEYDLKEVVGPMLQHETHPELKARMEKAVASAHKLIYAPENQRIRKPGSPRIDHGW